MLFGMGITFSSAQNEMDVMRYCQTTSAGSARSQAMGGAFSAVGADFSSTYLNPAGLGLYRKSEIMLTPGVKVISTGSNYLDGIGRDGASNFGFSNFGYVYTKDFNRESGFKSYNFAIGFNQIANFNRKIDVTAFNPYNSVSQTFADKAQGFTSAALNTNYGYPGLAFQAGMIIQDPNGGVTDWVPAVPGGNVEQRVQYGETGRQNEWNIAFSGNVDDFLYFGASVGIRDLKYKQEKFLLESDPDNLHYQDVADSTTFNYMDYYDVFTTRGTGFNARFGLILRPVDFIRVGMSVQTPTVYDLRDNYYTQIVGHFDNDPNSYQMPDDLNLPGQFSYRMTTPFTFTTGVMAMIGKMGFVSADVDLMDYTGSSLKVNNSPGNIFTTFQNENKNIQDMFAFSYNYRLGAEFRLNALRFRGGYASYGSVLKNEFLEYYEYTSGNLTKIHGNRRLITGGIGFKQKSYYLDVAFVNDVSQDRQLFYTIADPAGYAPELINKKTINSILMTIGFTF